MLDFDDPTAADDVDGDHWSKVSSDEEISLNNEATALLANDRKGNFNLKLYINSCQTNIKLSKTEKPTATPPSSLSLPLVRTNHPGSPSPCFISLSPPDKVQP